MEFIMSSGIKVPNAVIVSGLLESPEDEEIMDFLKKYGSMRLVPVTDINSEFYKKLIVEYQNDVAIEVLAPLLPYTHVLQDNPDVKYYIQALASVYTTKVGCSVTKVYLDEIKKLAKLSGRGFEEVLKDMMSEISEAIETDGSGDTEVGARQLNTSLDTFEPPQTQVLSDSSQERIICSGAEPCPTTNVKRSLSVVKNDLNPPEIQKVIVEQIVRRDELNTHSHFPIKLRSFSGKIPRPNSKTDYDTWRSHVELLRKDPTLSNLQKSRKIFESLLSPAADIVKRLSPEFTPETYIQLLDAAFGTVEDGEELFAQFMNTLQDPGEKASTYLCHLQAALNIAVKRGGAAAGEADRHILKQFCQGCWDNPLLSDLNLEEKKSHPPTFSELLLLTRTEEDRQAAKATRMKKHLGSHRQRAMASASVCSQQAAFQFESDPLTELKQQVASLQSQLTTLMSKKAKKVPKTKGNTEHPSGGPASKLDPRAPSWNPIDSKTSTQPRPWYCFNCGEDGHISSACRNNPNPTLVNEKKRSIERKATPLGG
ncbi:hypothetical protein DPEC_G00062700 [Dallia pectoralis]|uniref:Uncharacterized protein n=1 Tax=Dallia pectoralis TaxID=75939 RepID=A0ACC2H788_DALPE|nr:hypothetical protein DPEC_G00062700 [Dallia pectoralis]